MEQLAHQMLTVNWWVSVVVVGIAINLVSNYLPPYLGSKMASLSGYWRGKEQARKDKFNEQVAFLASRPDVRSIYALREMRYRVRTVLFLLLTALYFALIILGGSKLPVYVQLILAVVAFFTVAFGLSDHRGAMRVRSLVDASLADLRRLDP